MEARQQDYDLGSEYEHSNTCDWRCETSDSSKYSFSPPPRTSQLGSAHHQTPSRSLNYGQSQIAINVRTMAGTRVPLRPVSDTMLVGELASLVSNTDLVSNELVMDQYAAVKLCKVAGDSAIALSRHATLQQLDIGEGDELNVALVSISVDQQNSVVAKLRDGLVDLSDIDFDALATLMSIHLDDCHRVTDAVIKIVAEHCPKLRDIQMRMTSITDDSVAALARMCNRLTSVGLCGTKASDTSVNLLLRNVEGVSALEWDRETLHVHHEAGVLKLGLNRHQIGDGTIEHIAKTSERLSSLDLSETSITDQSLRILGRYCPELTEIRLAYTQVSDEAIVELSASCNHLRALEVDYKKAGQPCFATLRSELAVYGSRRGRAVTW